VTVVLHAIRALRAETIAVSRQTAGRGLAMLQLQLHSQSFNVC